MPSAPRIGRTMVSTFLAMVWTLSAIAGFGMPLYEMPLEYLQVVVPILLAAWPLVNLYLAIRDGRALAATDGRANVVSTARWLLLLLAVALNFGLLLIAFFFSSMLVNGPGVS